MKAWPPRDISREGKRRATTILAACGGLALAAISRGDAKADLRVCNKTHVLVNLAVGAPQGADFVTEGWWIVTPGSCATPIHGPLTGQFIYLYATGIDAVDVLKGSVSMCVNRVGFKIVGIADCWRRGLQAVDFVEIDTKDAAEWTTFLTDAGK